MSKTLRSSIIKLAHSNPKLRAELLPILTASVGKESDFKSTLDSLFKSYQKKHPDTKSPPPSLVEQAHKTDAEKEHSLKTEHPSLQKAEDSGKAKDEAKQKAEKEQAKKEQQQRNKEHQEGQDKHHKLTTHDPKNMTDAELAESDHTHHSVARSDQQTAHMYSGQGGDGSYEPRMNYDRDHHEKVKTEIEHRKTPEQKKSDSDKETHKQREHHESQAKHHETQAKHHSKGIETAKSDLADMIKDPSKATSQRSDGWGGTEVLDHKHHAEHSVKYHTEKKKHHEEQHKEHAEKARSLGKSAALRSATIRLAHLNPELRPHLLPILASSNRIAMNFPTKEALEAYRKEHKVGPGTKLTVDPEAHHEEQAKKHDEAAEADHHPHIEEHMEAADYHRDAAKRHKLNKPDAHKQTRMVDDLSESIWAKDKALKN